MMIPHDFSMTFRACRSQKRLLLVAFVPDNLSGVFDFFMHVFSLLCIYIYTHIC